jgi:UDP:flavonoid glycosyltransferase YjiC (YdhE family)
MWSEFDAFVREAGGSSLPDLEFIQHSPYLNLYLYPEDADYPRRRPLGRDWHRVESCLRRDDSGCWAAPPELAGDGALIYLSLGSLGSADVGLMTRLIDVLSRTQHRYVVSKGPCHDQFELAPNMWGGEYLPQPAILPQVDLVIMHGGNNTTTECFHHGKPSIVLPLFWDQYDNAQRVDETGFGVRLRTYDFDDAELPAAIDRLLADAALRERLAGISRRLQEHPGTVRAADLIERVAANA